MSLTPNNQDFHSSSCRGKDPKSLAGRPAEKSKLLGQVFTPPSIAHRMVQRLLATRGSIPIKILDPCVGPSTFPMWLFNSKKLRSNDRVSVFDIDSEMIASTMIWAKEHSLPKKQLSAEVKNYLLVPLGNQFDYAILNPPYIRQEWLDEKNLYQSVFKELYNLSIPGTSNLYVYFIVKVIQDLKVNGQFSCIVYDSWQSTIFGKWLKSFLNENCQSLLIENLPDQPFNGRLIDATILYGVKGKPVSERTHFTEQSETPFSSIKGFSPISSLFSSKRGLRLKQADFFLCSAQEAPKGATPFLKKIVKVNGYSVPETHDEFALIVTNNSEQAAIKTLILKRLALAQKNPKENTSVLTWWKDRPEHWFIHSEPPFAPILFNYYMRNRPKHIFNSNRCFSDNFYGIVPNKDISFFACLAVLNSTSSVIEILSHSRNQGNGLAKIQLFEYRNVYIPHLFHFSKKDIKALHSLGQRLVEFPGKATEIVFSIDRLLESIFADSRLSSNNLKENLLAVELKAKKPKEQKPCLGSVIRMTK